MTPNEVTALDAATLVGLHSGRQWRGASKFFLLGERYTQLTREVWSLILAA
jgi:hypothetical protein